MRHDPCRCMKVQYMESGMSEVSIASDRFWRELKSDIAGTLSDTQRGEIDRVLRLPPASANSEMGDLRLSLKWFFVRLAWGPEKRNPERIRQEQQLHPVMSRRNAPVLASLFAGYMIFWHIVAALSAMLVIYFII